MQENKDCRFFITLPLLRPRGILIVLMLAPFLFAQAPVVPIASVRFEGNRSISTQQLKHLLQMSLEGSQYVAGSLEADLQRVITAYRDEGFLKVKVGPPTVQIRTVGSEKAADIQIPVEEGPRYSAGAMAVKDARVLDPATLLQMCPLQKRSPYSRIQVARWQEKIAEAYREMGYIRMHSIVREVLNENDKVVDCTLECVEGNQYSVGKITLVADESIDRLQFKRHLLFSEGGVFNPEMLSLSIQFLNQTRIYKPISSSDIEVDIDDAQSLVNLTLHLEKAR